MRDRRPVVSVAEQQVRLLLKLRSASDVLMGKDPTT